VTSTLERLFDPLNYTALRPRKQKYYSIKDLIKDPIKISDGIFVQNDKRTDIDVLGRGCGFLETSLRLPGRSKKPRKSSQ
jgi:hypothetical protein